MAEAKSQMVGRAGEYMVAANILLRGGCVAWPATDDGYDLIGPNGCRVQVKSAHIRATPSIANAYPEGVYSFTLIRSSGTRKSARRKFETSKFSERCDVVVLWGIEQNRFWVTPAHVVDNVYGLYLGPNSDRAFEKDVPKMLEMLKEGMTQGEIGRRFGVCASSISTRLSRAGTPMHSMTASHKVRQCENAWEYITEFKPSVKQGSGLTLVESATA